MKKKIIAILNQSSILSDLDFELMVLACDLQIRRDVAPQWRLEPWPVRSYSSESRLPRHCLPIRIVDDSDDPRDADALGWHFETGDGQPFGRVFVNSVLNAVKTPAAKRKRIRSHSDSVSVILSHEVIESFVDPDINLWAYNTKDGLFHSYEACDPVQDQAYVIQVPGGRVHVSNFVTPEWFDAENVPGAHFDHMRKLKQPFSLAKGGYTTTNKANPEDVDLIGFNEKDLPQEKRHRAARTALRMAFQEGRKLQDRTRGKRKAAGVRKGAGRK